MKHWNNTRIEPCYTGGNIYVFAGNIDNKVFFIADSANYDVMIVDENVFKYGDELFEKCFYWDYQEEHAKSFLPPKNALIFFDKMLSWIESSQPFGNYCMSDIEWLHNDVLEIMASGNENWR